VKQCLEQSIWVCLKGIAIFYRTAQFEWQT
jgi:hypothetical protein